MPQHWPTSASKNATTGSWQGLEWRSVHFSKQTHASITQAVHTLKCVRVPQGRPHVHGRHVQGSTASALRPTVLGIASSAQVRGVRVSRSDRNPQFNPTGKSLRKGLAAVPGFCQIEVLRATANRLRVRAKAHPNGSESPFNTKAACLIRDDTFHRDVGAGMCKKDLQIGSR